MPDSHNVTKNPSRHEQEHPERTLSGVEEAVEGWRRSNPTLSAEPEIASQKRLAMTTEIMLHRKLVTVRRGAKQRVTIAAMKL